ncbi:putative nucleotidyltransferase with HDIG domain [Oxalobacteraceae bacterium GrIS 2.11]
MADNTKLIAIDQVCIGMFIKLDLSWFQHSFPMSSFKITNEQQIKELKALKLKHIRYVPEKTDLSALRSDASVAKAGSDAFTGTAVGDSEAEANASQEVFDNIIEAKKARFEKLQKQRQEIERCEAKFVQAATVVRNINKLIFSQPKETLIEAGKLIDSIADVFLTGNDAIMHLIQQKEGSEELYFHSLNVSVLAMMLAHEMKCTEAQIKAVGTAALFHDLGKVNIPDHINKKTTALTRPEQNLFELHGQYGVDVGSKAGMDKVTLEVIANHHEYLDGSGFPRKLKGEAIRMPTRIVTIANVYDNLCNHVDPNQSMTPHEALSLMYAHRRAQFDPAAMATLVKSLGVYPPGTLVKLSNDAVGLVMNVNVGQPLRPRIMVYDDEIPKEDAIILDLSVESKELAIKSSIRPGLLPRHIYDYLNPRKRVNYYVDSKSKNDKPAVAGGRG